MVNYSQEERYIRREEDVLNLIEKNRGFEITLGFINDVDHFIGGTKDMVWYYIGKGSKAEFWLGRHRDGQ